MRRIGIIICLIVLLCSSQVLAAIGTVTLKSGTVYERVNYIVDYDNKVLLIESGGWTQRILPERIEKIIDWEGNDVTTQILREIMSGSVSDTSKPAGGTDSGGVAVDSTKPPVAESSKRPVTGWGKWTPDRKPFDIALSTRLDFSVPFGDYYEGTTSGIGFEGDIKISLDHELALMFMVSRSGVKVSDNYRTGIYFLYPYILDREEIKLRATRYYIGLQRTSRIDRRANFPSLWYAWFAVGAVAHTTSGTIYYHDQVTNDLYAADATPSTDTRFAQSSGAGYIARIGKNVGIDISASLEAIWTKEYNMYGTTGVGMNGFAFDIKAGLVLLLGDAPK